MKKSTSRVCGLEENAQQPDEPVSPNESQTVDLDEAMEEYEKELEKEAKLPKEEEDIFEEMEKIMQDLEKQLLREEAQEDVPAVSVPEKSIEEEVEKHNLTHAQHRSWCKHCNRGLAQRDRHKIKKGYKYGKDGYIDVTQETLRIKQGSTVWIISPWKKRGRT